ncbi:MAG: hypothetical protein Q9223_007298, partial [Gallowayella weberi]
MDASQWAQIDVTYPQSVEKRNFDMFPPTARVMEAKQIDINIAWLRNYEHNHRPYEPHHLPMVGQIEDIRENLSQVCTVLARNEGLQTIQVTYPYGLSERNLRRLLGPLGWIQVESVIDLRADEEMGRVRDLQEVRELGVCEKIVRDLKRTTEDKRLSTTASAYPDIEWISIRDRAVQAGLLSSKNSFFYQIWLAIATGDLDRFENWKRQIER